MYNYSNEKDLIEGVANGNIHAFKTLFANYYKKLFNFAYHLTHSREDAEEIIHDVFARVWENRENLNKELSFNAYIGTIARNIIYNRLRRKSYENAYKKQMDKFLPVSHNETEDEILFADLAHLCKEAIAKLPPRRKLIYHLSREEGMSYKDISAHLQISENTVKEQMSQALRYLKEYLTIHNGTLILLILLTLL